MKHPTRRTFLKNSAVATGALVLGGLTLADQASLSLAHAGRIDFPETGCGAENVQGKKILVAYASMHGSTGQVAQDIGRVFCESGASADVRLVNHVEDPSAYDAFVIGSAIRSDTWLPEAKNFVSDHKDLLSRAPVAYFLTCLTLSQASPERLEIARTFLDPVLTEIPEVRPLSTGLFGGVLDYSKLSFGMGAVMRYKMWAKGVKEGDYRDWDAIRSWSTALASRY